MSIYFGQTYKHLATYANEHTNLHESNADTNNKIQRALIRKFKQQNNSCWLINSYKGTFREYKGGRVYSFEYNLMTNNRAEAIKLCTLARESVLNFWNYIRTSNLQDNLLVWV